MAQKKQSVGRKRPNKSGIQFIDTGEAQPNPFVRVEHRKVTERKPDGSAKDKIFTLMHLKDSTTVGVFGIDPSTGRYAILVAREAKITYGRDVTTAAGSGYMDKGDKSDPTKTGARKLQRESGMDMTDETVIDVLDFNAGTGARAYPQNIAGEHFYTGVHVREFPELPESKPVFLIDLFPSADMLADKDQMAQYHQDTQEHEVLWMVILLIRNHLLMEGKCDRYGTPT